MNKGKLRCSFCNNTADNTEFMIEGLNANICDKCIDLCQDIITEERNEVMCRKAQARWSEVSITSLEEAVDLIRACGEATELRYLLDHVDLQVQEGNLVLEDNDWPKISQLVNEIKATRLQQN